MEPTHSLAIKKRFQGRTASRIVRMEDVIYRDRKAAV